MTVESYGNADNLMIEWALIERGGHPVVRHRAGHEQRFRDLSAFEDCLRLAAATVAKST
jgi:hypothetical protein